MGRVEADQAFLDDLLAGLEPDPLPSSSQPASSQPTRPPRPPPQKRTQPPPSARTAPVSRVVSPAPGSFWADPFSRPALSQNSLAERDRREREVGITGPSAEAARRKQAGGAGVGAGAGGVLSPKPNRVVGAKRMREDEGSKGRAPKHVAVELEPRSGKENAEAARPAKRSTTLVVVKQEEEDEFGDTGMEEVDWDAAFAGLEEPVAVVKPPPRSQQYTRCRVEEVVDHVGPTMRPQKIITISSSAFEGVRQVVLCEDWAETPVESGDVVNLVGDLDLSSADLSSPILTLTRSTGLLILHPDILVSATKVADSTNCTRKAVLSELIRTLDGLCPSLVYGNMLHALLQASLAEGRWDDEWRFAKIGEIVKQTGGQLWTMDVELDKAVRELKERSKEFEDFAERFVSDKPKPDALLSDPRAASSARSRLAITSTLSIEEDIWSPRYGLKGKIDVSTAATLVDSVGFTRKGTMPFEVKTGRATAGMEHRAQTMLYTRLMSDRYDEDIEAGLLYYTQGNEVFRVQAARNEIRGLILARNRFATYLHRRMTLSPAGFPPSSQLLSQSQYAVASSPVKPKTEPAQDDEDDDAALWGDFDTELAPTGTPTASQRERVALLPPPIDEERSCKKCFVRDACFLFRRAVEGDVEICSDPSDSLQELFDDLTGHLTDAHAEFFKHWEKLISYEEQELVRFKKEIWTMGAVEREKVGRCLANMVVVGEEVQDTAEQPSIHRFTYRLQPRQPPSSGSTPVAVPSLLGGSVTAGDPVVISLEEPSVLAISRGFVLSITAQEVVLGLDQSLTSFPQAQRVPSAQRVFRIDKDELAAGMGRIRDNLIQLFVKGGDERRRRLIVDLEAPSFNAVLGESEKENSRLIPSNLNEDQKGALEKVLAALDYALILGMPGTGKTTTIAEVIKALAAAGKSVLLTSYTHSAVDNILLKVKDAGLDILRLGNRDKIMPALHHLTLTPEDYSTSLTDIDKKLTRPQIVAMTCLGINEPIFTKRRFDVCIVDEASQVTLPTCLGPLRFADKFVLVGDHNQLPPLVRNHSARKGGLDVSLFKRLSDAHPAAVANLAHQYRMNSDIMLLSNELIYEGKLEVGSEEVGKRRLALPKVEEFEGLGEWEKEVVCPSRTVLFVDTDALPAQEQRKGSLIENELEGLLIKQSIAALTTCGVAETDIGVITPYRQQIKLLNREVQRPFPGVEVLTADRSQGRDKEVILVSLVRSNSSGNVGELLKDWRRLNVCLTRARSKLVLFGSRTTLRHSALLRQFLDLVEEKGWVYELEAGVRAELEGVKTEMKEAEDERVKVEEQEGEKPLRRGGGALALRKPLAMDVLNSI
ncbi:hypothetical protein JCM8097_001691 [Rhodosporidiobolus ruineniae]